MWLGQCLFFKYCADTVSNFYHFKLLNPPQLKQTRLLICLRVFWPTTELAFDIALVSPFFQIINIIFFFFLILVVQSCTCGFFMSFKLRLLHETSFQNVLREIGGHS